MKITLIPNLTRKEAAGVTEGICKSLKSLGADFCFFPEYKDEFEFTGARFLPESEAIEDCDAVIAIGGDGSITGAKCTTSNTVIALSTTIIADFIVVFI